MENNTTTCKTLSTGKPASHRFKGSDRCHRCGAHRVNMEHNTSDATVIRAGMTLRNAEKGSTVYVKSASARFVNLKRQADMFRGWRVETALVVERFTTLDGAALVAPAEKVKKAPTEPAGTCGSCFRTQQTRNAGRLVDHGYTIPQNWHQRNGGCMGVRYLAFELSTEATVLTRDAIESYAGGQERRLDRLNSGAVTELPDPQDSYRSMQEHRAQKTLTPADEYRWTRALDSAKEDAAYQAKTARRQAAVLDAKIASWTLGELKVTR